MILKESYLRSDLVFLHDAEKWELNLLYLCKNHPILPFFLQKKYVGLIKKDVIKRSIFQENFVEADFGEKDF